ncbi:MAG TPA: hypothetical protein VKU90_08960 [Caulobacteraceae bacterium]|nr:hypothetical protein [Caulobacteraceae bacterium]
MVRSGILKTALAFGVAAVTATAVAPALAQGYPPPPPYDRGPDGGPYRGPDSVQPPPGYEARDASEDNSPQAREEDQRYSYAAERWAAENCIAAHQNGTAAGAVIGGIFGAVIGAGIAGPHDRGAGAVIGAGVGGLTGAAIGASAANDNPNCPPGYALREGAPAFYPGPVYGPIVYEAPDGYDPWFWDDGHWIYRPYPYHRFWYEQHEGRGFDHDRDHDRGWDRDRGDHDRGDHDRGDRGDHDRGDRDDH